MFRRCHLSAAVCLFALLGLAAPVADAFEYWSNKDGTGSFFEWHNGGSDNGLFGDPTVVDDTFVFFPDAFRAESVDGDPDIISDRIEVELIAFEGYLFSEIVITEYGDYGIFDEGEVSVTGSLFLTRLNDGFDVMTDDLESDPPSPITEGDGDWTAEVGIDLSSQFPEWTHITLVLDNNLIALSVPGSTTFIEKKVTGAAVSVEIIPEPTGLALLLAGAALIRRRS